MKVQVTYKCQNCGLKFSMTEYVDGPELDNELESFHNNQPSIFKHTKHHTCNISALGNTNVGIGNLILLTVNNKD